MTATGFSQTYVNINGELFSPERLSEAKISVFDRGLLYGDSIYEVTCTYEKILFKWEEHLDRLFSSAEGLSLPINYSRKELTELAYQTLGPLNVGEAYLRLVITRGEGPLSLSFGERPLQNNVIVITKPLPPNPDWWYSKGVHMIIAQTLRTPKESFDPNIKSGNYLNNVMAHHEAMKAQAYDAIMLNRQGHVTEGTTSNVWMVKDGNILTPPLGAGILGGITRQTLFELGREKKLKMREANFTPDELLAADEVFITSTTRQVVPVTQIDQTPIGSEGKPGPTTLKLLRFYQEHVREVIENAKKKAPHT